MAEAGAPPKWIVPTRVGVNRPLTRTFSFQSHRPHARGGEPDLPARFPTHAELEARNETGQRDGKTDVAKDGTELRSRIMARLGEVEGA